VIELAVGRLIPLQKILDINAELVCDAPRRVVLQRVVCVGVLRHRGKLRQVEGASARWNVAAHWWGLKDYATHTGVNERLRCCSPWRACQGSSAGATQANKFAARTAGWLAGRLAFWLGLHDSGLLRLLKFRMRANKGSKRERRPKQHKKTNRSGTQSTSTTHANAALTSSELDNDERLQRVVYSDGRIQRPNTTTKQRTLARNERANDGTVEYELLYSQSKRSNNDRTTTHNDYEQRRTITGNERTGEGRKEGRTTNADSQTVNDDEHLPTTVKS